MRDHMLVIPNIWRAEQESYIQQEVVDFPTIRISEVTCVMKDVDSKDPVSKRSGDDAVPVTFYESDNLSKCDQAEYSIFENSRPVDLNVLTQYFTGTLM